MTSTTRTELMNLAKQAAAYITKLNGEAETFEIESNGITAVIAYGAELVDRGRNAIEAVYDEDGNEDKEAAEWLEKQLN